jgi:hypothetical protein
VKSSILFQSVDWIAMWHIYRPFFISAYVFFSFLIRLWLARRLTLGSWIKNWLISSSASLAILLSFPLIVIICSPAWIILVLLTGRKVADSLLMAVPIAASVAAFNTSLDVTVVRRLLRTAMSNRQIGLVSRANCAIAGLVIATVIALHLLHPVEVIAAVHSPSDAWQGTR